MDAGGEDTAPTPTEFVIAGLAACIAHYARRYLARHDISAAGLAVATSYILGGKPARVTDISIRITPPPALPDERRAAFLAVASHCTIHNTFQQPPVIDIALADTAFAGAARGALNRPGVSGGSIC